MSIYSGAPGESSMSSHGGGGNKGGCIEAVQEGLSSTDAFKRSRPAQGCALISLVVVIFMGFRFTTTGQEELAEVGYITPANDDRALLMKACGEKKSEYQTNNANQVYPTDLAEWAQDVPVCQCVADLDALVKNRDGRKTELSIPIPITHEAGKKITVTYSGATDEKDWIALYEKGTVPSADSSHDWHYHDNPTGSGTVDLTPGSPGDYYITMFCCNGYVELSPRLEISVVPRAKNMQINLQPWRQPNGSPPLPAPLSNGQVPGYYAGEPITFTTQAPTGTTDQQDWIGMYEVGKDPIADNVHDWNYHQSDQFGSGSNSLTPTKAGDYYIVIFCCNGYVETSQRYDVRVDCPPTTTAGSITWAVGSPQLSCDAKEPRCAPEPC